MIGVVLVCVFLGIIMLGVPISFGMGASTAVAMLLGRYNLSQIPVLLQKGISNYYLVSIVYFVLAANIMNTGGITRRIFTFCESLVGWMRGGLAQVNVLSSVIFSGISGTSSADAAGLGLLEITAMKEKGYDLGWSTSITLASSLLGPIIPPSVAFIVYAMLAEVSAADMFIAGIVPGVTLTIILMIMNYFVARSGKVKCPQPVPFRLGLVWTTLKDGFFALLAPVVVLACIFSGAVTATEAGVIAVLYATFATAIYHELSLKNIKLALFDTVIASALIMFLVGFGSTIGWVLTIERIPQMITLAMTSFTSNRVVLLLLINILLLVLGMFLDNTTIRIITVPLLLPLIDLLGISRIHFGVFHTLNVLIGTCTPPVGVGLMIMSSITRQKFTDVVRSFMPWYLPLFLALLLLTFIPELSTWLPGLMK
jgi:tripartite ATP-independent transporter DctM subunit